MRTVLGASNTIIADTAVLGRRTTGLPRLSDPKGRIAYAVHPYTFEVATSFWDEHFGALARVAPVVVTEWNYIGEDCGTLKEKRAPDFLGYLRAHNIGVLGHAFDVPGTVIRDWSWLPTLCGSGVGGSGQLLRSFFR
jgi:hypothetical protein